MTRLWTWALFPQGWEQLKGPTHSPNCLQVGKSESHVSFIVVLSMGKLGCGCLLVSGGMLLSLYRPVKKLVLQCLSCSSFTCRCSVVSDSVTPWTVAYEDPLSMGFSSKSTGVGCHFLLQGIFPTQGLNPGPLHCRQTFYPLKPSGKPP